MKKAPILYSLNIFIRGIKENECVEITINTISDYSRVDLNERNDWGRAVNKGRRAKQLRWAFGESYPERDHLAFGI